DPRQLQQPQRGAHPEGADVSALDHLLGEHATIAPGQGLFLAETWRLPPKLCAFTSELFYEDRLVSRRECQIQALTGPTPFAGAGLFLVPVPHAGNTSAAPEEVAAAERVVAALLVPGVAWTDRQGASHPLTPADLLLIAPYNAQVAALTRAFRAAGRELAVGTVDRFQGQERPVVLYSLTSSSALDAPRGLAFLLDLHRLNVATSRAQCVVIVLASPALFEAECRTPAEMRLANGACRLRELGVRVEV
ncbi:MAG TPA: C-terminal helicase domain-containing protein, partial [Planctomycetota bacterium]